MKWLSLNWLHLKRFIGIDPSTPINSQEGQLRYQRSSDSADGLLYLARRTSGGTMEWKDLTATTSGTVIVQVGDATVDAAVTTLDFNATNFAVTSSPSGEANISIISSGVSVEVWEAGVLASTATVINLDGTDFNVTDSPAGQANVSLNYGTTANVPAEGNHTHSAAYAPIAAKYIVQTLDADLTAEQSLGALTTGLLKNTVTAGTGVLSKAVAGTDYQAPFIVQEGAVDVDTAVTTINFDDTDFNTSNSPAHTINVSLNYGTTANTPAEGNHTHGSFASPVSFDGDVTIGNSQADTLIIGSHIQATGTDPTVANTPVGTYAAAGTTPGAVTINGNDSFMFISFATGTTPAAGALCKITFSTARPSANYGYWIQGMLSSTADLNMYGSRTTTDLTISVKTAPPASTTIRLAVLIIDTP